MNRRDFLTKSTQAGAGFALGGFLARAYGNPSAVGPLAATAISPNDRVLVIVQLDGSGREDTIREQNVFARCNRVVDRTRV